MRSLFFALLAATATALSSPAPAHAAERDPPIRDAAFPPGVVEFTISSEGETMNAHAYTAMGAGPHPTVVLVHGYPGNEKNLDIAQELRRAGMNAVFFHPRGAWGSTGFWSVTHSLRDIRAVIDRVRSDFGRTELRADPRHVALLGHSLGGFLTLMSVAEGVDLNCAASMAGVNLGLRHALSADDPTAQAALRGRLSVRPPPQLWAGGYTLHAEIEEAGAHWNLLTHAAALADRPLLLVAATQDTVVPPEVSHRPLVDAVRGQQRGRLQTLELDDGHSFSATRLALTDAVTHFFRSSCGFPEQR